VDAWLDGAAPDVLFVPVSIDYERLIEAGSYARELAGGEKRKESVRGLLGILAILFRRYERLHVQFEAPISLAALARDRLGERAAALAVDDAWSGEAGERTRPGEPPAEGPEAKRRLVQAVANRIAWSIARATTVTPVGLLATALLGDAGGPVAASTLARRIELLRYLAATDGARFARGLEGAPSDPLVPGAIADALARLCSERLVREAPGAPEPAWEVPAERRPLVDFHRNAVLHRYVALAIVAAAIRARRDPEDAWGAFDRAGFVSRLLKLEFMYQPGTSAEEAFESLVSVLERLGAVERAGGTLRAGASPETLDFLAGLIAPFLEGYRLALESAIELLATPSRRSFTRRRLVSAALERGGKETGAVLHAEAVSKATVENAVEWLILGQFLRETADGQLSEGPAPQGLRAVVDRMNPLLAS
jgi:glycerol-3-phosphate O-acyltransferase